MSINLMIGSDPELFTRNGDGKVSSVAGLLGADKYHKKEYSEDVRIQEDNVLIEFDINPHTSFDTFDDNMSRGIKACEDVAKSVGNDVDLDICSHVFTEEELKTFHKDAFLFGCEPDFNALNGSVNQKPSSVDIGLRTAGGHIHIGYSDAMEVTQQNQSLVGVLCDYYMGMPAILLDSDDRRKELYGKAGACRYKNYGIEYRVLSNFWVTKKETRKWAWDQALKAFGMVTDDNFMTLFSIINPEEVQRVINANDKAMAEQYIKLMEIM